MRLNKRILLNSNYHIISTENVVIFQTAEFAKSPHSDILKAPFKFHTSMKILYTAGIQNFITSSVNHY